MATVIDELVGLLGYEFTGENELKRFLSGMDRAERQAGNTSLNLSSIGNSLNRALPAVREFSSILATAALSATAIGAGVIAGGFKSVITAGADKESSITMLGSLEGEDDAVKSYARLQALAAKTVTDKSILVAGYAKFRGAGYKEEEADDMTLLAADIQAAKGGSIDVFNRVTSTLMQMKSLGAIQKEDTNRLTELGIPIIKMMSKQMGMDEFEVQKLMGRGELKGEKYMLMVENLLKKKFGGASKAASNTYLGILNNIGDAINVALEGIADKGAFDATKKMLDEGKKSFEAFFKSADGQKFQQQISDTMVSALKSIRKFLTSFSAEEITKGFRKAVDIISKTIDFIAKVFDKLSKVKARLQEIFGDNKGLALFIGGLFALTVALGPTMALLVALVPLIVGITSVLFAVVAGLVKFVAITVIGKGAILAFIVAFKLMKVAMLSTAIVGLAASKWLWGITKATFVAKAAVVNFMLGIRQLPNALRAAFGLIPSILKKIRMSFYIWQFRVADAIAFVRNAFGSIPRMIAALRSIVPALLNVVRGGASFAGGFAKIGKSILGFARSVPGINIIIGVISGLWAAFKEWQDGGSLGQIIAAFFGGVWDSIVGFIPMLLDWAAKLINFLTGGLVDLTKITGWLRDFLSWDNVSGMALSFLDGVLNFVDGIQMAFMNFKVWMAGLWESIFDFDISKRFPMIGKLLSLAGSVSYATGLTGLASDSIDGLKSLGGGMANLAGFDLGQTSTGNVVTTNNNIKVDQVVQNGSTAPGLAATAVVDAINSNTSQLAVEQLPVL